MTTKAIDVSNYTSTLTPESLAAWKADGVGLVIPQAVDPPAGFPPGKTRLQVRQCSDAGFVVDAYVWLWFDLDVDDIQRKLALLEGLPIRRLWLDVEDEAAAKYDKDTCERKVSAAMLACTMYATTSGDTVGIYSGHWFWTDPRYMANSTAFSKWDLWDSNYDGEADATVNFRPYGGWDHATIKQYQGTTNFHGISGVDMNVLSDAEAAKLTGGTPPVDDTERAQMQDTINGLVSSIGVIAGDALAPVVKQKTPATKAVKNLVATIRSQADSHGINHA